MSVLSEYGLKVGDKIKVGKNAGPFFNKGDILTISEDDGDCIPCCKNQEGFLEYFDLETREWTKVEDEPMFDYKFQVGDKVRVATDSFGTAGDIGTIVEITERGEYMGGPGYKVSPAIGNTAIGAYGGFIGEVTFDLVAPAKLKRDSVVSLELTGEELFWIKALVGKTTGNYMEDLYNKVSEYIEGYVLRYVLRTINLHDQEDKIEAELNRIFPPEESVKEDPKEMTLEEICQELGYDVKVVKNKQEG